MFISDFMIPGYQEHLFEDGCTSKENNRLHTSSRFSVNINSCKLESLKQQIK